MLAKLFNNISIPSLARAVIFAVLVSVLSVIWLASTQEELVIGLFDVDVSLAMYKGLLPVIVLAVAFGLNSGINYVGFLKQDYQFLPVFVLLTLGMFMAGSGSIELLLSLPLGTLLFYRLLMLVGAVDPSYILFDSGVLLGLMTMLLPESAFFLLIIWIATFNFGHAGLRTFIMPVLGLAAIYFMISTLLFWLSDIDGPGYLMERFSGLEIGFHFRDIRHVWVYIPLVLACIPALLETAQVYGKANVKKRQVFTFFLVVSLLLIAAGTFVEESENLWIWLSIPISALIVNLIHYRQKNWQKDIFYLLLLIFVALSVLV